MRAMAPPLLAALTATASLGASLGASACGSSPPHTTGTAPAAADEAFGPLEVGADSATYRRLTTDRFRSLVHGNRFVHVYANEVGADAYLAGGDIPVGTILVKESVENVDGQPSDIPGPLYIMQKRAKGYAPAHDDWWYAIYWATPPAADRQQFGGPIYWRGASPRVNYCWKCHDDYVNSVGGLVPSSLLPR